MNPFNLSEIINDNIKRLSLLRKIEMPRDCFFMDMSSEFCLCKGTFNTFDSIDFKDDDFFPSFNVLMRTMRRNFVNFLNKKMIEGEIERKCSKIKIKSDGIFDITYMKTNRDGIIFFVIMEVNLKGIYEGYFDKNGNLFNEYNFRIDKYSLYTLYEGYFDENGNLFNEYNFRIDKYSLYTSKCNPKTTHEKFCYCRNNNIKL
uniref:Uncharacterized protein n=1 Tax=Parastrongyloides trichosuri TaxID=131310 RepID=A0A0N4ZVV2_PARTI